MPQSQALVLRLAQVEGIDGCALVEVDTGMAWHAAGQLPDIEKIAEAAIEFWRVQSRLAVHMESFGSLTFVAYAFANRVVTLFPCKSACNLVLVSVAQPSGVDWKSWNLNMQALRTVLVSK